MIRSHYSAKANLLVATHRLQHIRRTIIVECLDEVGGRTPDIAEMHKVNMLFHCTNSCRDVYARGCETTLAEGQSIIRAGNQRQRPLECLDICEYSPNASDRRNRRIIGVERKFNARLFSNRHYTFDEVCEVVPELLFAHHACFGERSLCHQFVIVTGDERATT